MAMNEYNEIHRAILGIQPVQKHVSGLACTSKSQRQNSFWSDQWSLLRCINGTAGGRLHANANANANASATLCAMPIDSCFLS